MSNRRTARLNKDISSEMKRGDIVEIVPEYDIAFGERVKDLFEMNRGDIVIKKINEDENHKNIVVRKCSKNDLEMI